MEYIVVVFFFFIVQRTIKDKDEIQEIDWESKFGKRI